MFTNPKAKPEIVETPCVACGGSVTTSAQHRGPVVCLRCGVISYVGMRRAG